MSPEKAVVNVMRDRIGMDQVNSLKNNYQKMKFEYWDITLRKCRKYVNNFFLLKIRIIKLKVI